MEKLKRSFPPVTDERTRLLVLGSLPGEESLARGQYYANPRNQFWRLMERVLEIGLTALPYDERLQALLDYGVGLWDTVGSATRNGSLDGAIRGLRANPLAERVEALAELRAVAFNGGKAASLGIPQLAGQERLTLVRLPSSSPAFTLAFEAKAERWMKLRDFIARPGSSS